MLKLALAALLGLLAAAAQPWAAPALNAQSSDAAGVRVVVKPKSIGPAASAWEFEVVMDTHTKSLNENLTKAAVLVDDAGRRHIPTAWDGDAPGGHHRKGVLRFATPPLDARGVTLEIAGLGGVPVRTFRWELK